MVFMELKPVSRFKKWKQIKKAHNATEVCTIVVTAIKEQQVGVYR